MLLLLLYLSGLCSWSSRSQRCRITPSGLGLGRFPQAQVRVCAQVICVLHSKSFACVDESFCMFQSFSTAPAEQSSCLGLESSASILQFRLLNRCLSTNTCGLVFYLPFFRGCISGVCSLTARISYYGHHDDVCARVT